MAAAPPLQRPRTQALHWQPTPIHIFIAWAALGAILAAAASASLRDPGATLPSWALQLQHEASVGDPGFPPLLQAPDRHSSPFVLVHLPKCAGTSARNVLSSIMIAKGTPASRLCIPGTPATPSYTILNVSVCTDRSPAPVVLAAGHFHYEWTTEKLAAISEVRGEHGHASVGSMGARGRETSPSVPFPTQTPQHTPRRPPHAQCPLWLHDCVNKLLAFQCVHDRDASWHDVETLTQCPLFFFGCR